ncbi:MULTISPECIES: hypothetical protein [unclassified Streptomyces]|uniref:hypothetical protein n=1 Tax=unclassified Streptomyces TaxID=2593676 RepID=UPI0006F94F38|nr:MULTISPECIES: hypothetical protein [unclassified Streptomyces]KQX57929.1 hypothetical protein ASD33_25900 [Streptomyces sp. Root1304]KRA78813.1 hypothetical protein ASE09_23455 [Streptomyces sp. Root66D1]
MSTAPAHGPRDAKRPGASPSPENSPKPVLVFDDPLDRQSADDTDRGWGERPPAGGSSAADLARFLDEKPPHHL